MDPEVHFACRPPKALMLLLEISIFHLCIFVRQWDIRKYSFYV